MEWTFWKRQDTFKLIVDGKSRILLRKTNLAWPIVAQWYRLLKSDDCVKFIPWNKTNCLNIKNKINTIGDYVF